MYNTDDDALPCIQDVRPVKRPFANAHLNQDPRFLKLITTYKAKPSQLFETKAVIARRIGNLPTTKLKPLQFSPEVHVIAKKEVFKEE